MKRWCLAAVVALSACNGDIIEVVESVDAGEAGGSGGAGGAGGGPAEGGTQGEPGLNLDTASRVTAWLNEKTLTMEGDRLPSHPNGFDEDTNFGQATQCYQRVVIQPIEGRWITSSQLGTLQDAANVGDVGTCDHDTPGALLEFTSTAVLIENVQGNGECFDITMTYPGFSQEGRGAVVGDGAEVHLEIFFKDQATGHRCADGKPGDDTVTLNGNPFTGDATQVYEVSE